MENLSAACAALLGAFGLAGCGAAPDRAPSASVGPAVLVSTAGGVYELTKSATIHPGGRARLWFATNVKPDCSSGAAGRIKLVAPPLHGEFSQGPATDSAAFPAANPLRHCNGRLIEGLEVAYAGAPGFVGRDGLKFDILYPNGKIAHVDISIDSR